MKFNFTRGAKTPRGTKPRSTRMITKDHDAYKIYILAKQLQLADGMPLKGSRVDEKYIDLAIKELSNKQKEVTE